MRSIRLPGFILIKGNDAGREKRTEKQQTEINFLCFRFQQKKD